MSDRDFRPRSPAASLLFSTVRITTETLNRQTSGTGFLYKHVLPNERIKERGIPFLVTNRHVVANAKKGRIVFLQAADRQRIRGIIGRPYPLEIGDFSEFWIYHPDRSVDLAIMDLSIFLEMAYETHRVQLFFRPATAEDIPSPSAINNIDVIESVFMIGYPIAIMDEVNHLPIVRHGITATPYRFNYQGRAEFLVDASIFPGSSGSPVFLWDQRKSDLSDSKRLHLLGILSGGFCRDVESQNLTRKDIPTGIPTGRYKEMIDLGVVVKAQRIFELIAIWEQQKAESNYVAGQDDEEKARIRDEDVNRLIYGLLKDLNLSSWQELERHLGSTFVFHLLTKFKTSGLDPTERLCLFRLLQPKD